MCATCRGATSMLCSYCNERQPAEEFRKPFSIELLEQCATCRALTEATCTCCGDAPSITEFRKPSSPGLFFHCATCRAAATIKCSVCLTYQPPEEFQKPSSTQLYKRCAACRVQRKDEQVNRQNKKLEKAEASIKKQADGGFTTRYCEKCHKYLDLSNFARRHSSKLLKTCISCRNRSNKR